MTSPSGSTITIGKKTILQMASNDYLGLANHPSIKKEAREGISRWGTGSAASRLISGTTIPHQKLERELAKFKGTESALTFGSGYTANLGIIPTLINSNELILADRLCHASLIDGCRLAKADMRVFHHNDLDHLERLLTKRPHSRPTLIVTEGVFSMDGDVSFVPQLTKLAQTYGANIFLDDAHGTGVMGPNGRGTLEHFGVNPNQCLQMGTLSKAIGTCGGYVVGSDAFIQYLVNTARSFMYTTAPPPAMAVAAIAALKIIKKDRQRRMRLWKNRQFLYAGLQDIGFTLTETQSPILPILLKNPETALDMSKRLLAAGIFIPAIRPPTVPKGSSRLRLTVTSEHTTTQLNRVLDALRHIGQSMRVI